MARGYVYKRPVKRSHYSNFRRQLIISCFFIAAFIAVGYFIYAGLHRPEPKAVTSAIETTEITGNKTTFTNDYFQFQDTGKWILEKNSGGTATKLVYHKFRKNVLEHEFVAYINQVPIPLNLATSRVLPVRIVNTNSLQVTNVSSPCGTEYAKGELHKVKELSINNATMLCDPDSPQYSVVFSEISGDYRLKMKRSSAAPIQFVIIYKDTGAAPQTDSIINIASSFKVL
ncbi:hypothetical protein KW803_00620 [Candidatus Saccharibacteria bacterium]|nr:hypothetical protein [Candidatus Saccharibacteria bacterium]